MNKILNEKFYNALTTELKLIWTDSFLECKTEEQLKEYFSKSSSSFENFINHSFTWSDTAQGHQFWSNVTIHLNDSINSQVISNSEIIRVYVVGEDSQYFYWLKNSSKYSYLYEKDIYKSDLVIFTGGEDVHFSLYANENNKEYQ